MDVGIDLTSIARFRSKEEEYANILLTALEWEIYETLTEERKATFLATRWAVKEAIFKVTQDEDYIEYSVLNAASGKPFIEGHDEMKVSISHEGDYVVAIVIKEK